jgi:kynureninase
VTLSGHNLVEILVKYLQDVTSPWEVTEPVADHLPQRSVRQIALRYAEAEIGRISQDGRRAHQPAKKAGWQTLPTGLGEQVARLVDAIVNEKPIDEALGEIELGDPR